MPASLLNHAEEITTPKVALVLVRVGRQLRLAACAAEPAPPAEDEADRSLRLRDSLEDAAISLHSTVPCLTGESMAELMQREPLKVFFDAIDSFVSGSTYRLRNIAEVPGDVVIPALEELRLHGVAEGQEQQAAGPAPYVPHAANPAAAAALIPVPAVPQGAAGGADPVGLNVFSPSVQVGSSPSEAHHPHAWVSSSLLPLLAPQRPVARIFSAQDRHLHLPFK